MNVNEIDVQKTALLFFDMLNVYGATDGSWEQQVIEELKPAPEDTIIPKYRWSTFHQTDFDLALRARGLDTIIISGIIMICLITTHPPPPLTKGGQGRILRGGEYEAS